jgi:cell division septation protein DedD
MDQSLKERLIGAAVLVALGVWLIPWLLDGRQEQANLGSSGSALRLPAPDGPLPVRSQTLALDAAKSDPFVADAQHADAAEPTTLAAAEPSAAAESSATAPNAAPKPTQPAPAVAAPERIAAAAPAKPVSEPKATQRVAAASKPAEPPAATHAAPAKTDARGDWAVQLGVFSAEDNARRLAQKVNVYGYKPEVASYKSNGRAMYRVRLGPYLSRAEADATASALSAHSFAARVVAAD